MNRARSSLAVTALLATLALAPTASAQHVSAAAMVGYASGDQVQSVGVHGGYTLPGTPVFLGAAAIYHAGINSPTDPTTALSGGPQNLREQSASFVLEGGWDFRLVPWRGRERWTLRPMLGIGFFLNVATTTYASEPKQTDTSVNPLFVIGGQALFRIIGPLQVGVDLRESVSFIGGTASQFFAGYGLVGVDF
jgi:hypothetical protein